MSEEVQLRLRESELEADRERELLDGATGPAVYASRASTMAERLSIAAVERSFRSRFACSSEAVCEWMVCAAARSLWLDRCV